MKIIDYINTNFSIGKKLFYNKWEIDYSDCKNRADLDMVKIYYLPLSIKLKHDFDLDEFEKALNSSLENLPKWFKDKIKCEKDDHIPYIEYFDGFKKSLETFEFNLAYAKGMRDCLDGYFKIDKDVKFSDFADFLHNFSLHYEKVLLKDEKQLIAYYKSSNQIRAVIKERLNDDCVSFIDYEESPCALLAASYSSFIDLQCGFDLDNLFDIMETGYEGVECYAFENGYSIDGDGFTNTNLINVSSKNYLPKKISFYNYCYKNVKKFDVFKFSKAVLCNEALIKWIDAGICAFENYYVEKDNDEYYLVNDDEKIKLNNKPRWCDIKGLKVLNHDDSKWQERMQNYKIAYKNRLNRMLKWLEDDIKECGSKDKINLKEQIINTKNKLKELENLIDF